VDNDVLIRSPDGRTLYPLLEGTVAGDTPGNLRMYEFDVATSTYTSRRWTYRMDDPSHSVPDAIAIDANRFLTIERDDGQGADAVFKHVYLLDRRVTNPDGTLAKTLVALTDWYRTGADGPALMPRLATYLGHTDAKNTFWYSRVGPGMQHGNRLRAARPHPLAAPTT
jgi:hypothetical protein